MPKEQSHEVFDGKPLSELLKDIHDNTIAKRAKIDEIIDSLAKLMQSSNSADAAVVLAPILKEYLDVGIKNDEQLVKIATVTQRVISAKLHAGGDTDEGYLTPEEKSQVMKNALADMHLSAKEVIDKLNDIKAT